MGQCYRRAGALLSSGSSARGAFPGTFASVAYVGEAFGAASRPSRTVAFTAASRPSRTMAFAFTGGAFASASRPSPGATGRVEVSVSFPYMSPMKLGKLLVLYRRREL